MGEGRPREIRAVVFDVGETLVCEDRAWTAWASWIGVPSSHFFTALGATIAQRIHHREAFTMVRPGMDLEHEVAARSAAGQRWRIEAQDLYPDARRCLERLRQAGLVVGIAGNQPSSMVRDLEALDLPVDFIGTSGAWGVTKPSAAFFERVAAAAGHPTEHLAYVGDRVDNDVLPAKEAGMTAIFLRRGPWGLVQAGWPEARAADAVVDDLDEVAQYVAEVSGA